MQAIALTTGAKKKKGRKKIIKKKNKKEVHLWIFHRSASDSVAISPDVCQTFEREFNSEETTWMSTRIPSKSFSFFYFTWGKKKRNHIRSSRNVACKKKKKNSRKIDSSSLRSISISTLLTRLHKTLRWKMIKVVRETRSMTNLRFVGQRATPWQYGGPRVWGRELAEISFWPCTVGRERVI